MGFLVAIALSTLRNKQSLLNTASITVSLDSLESAMIHILGQKDNEKCGNRGHHAYVLPQRELRTRMSTDRTPHLAMHANQIKRRLGARREKDKARDVQLMNGKDIAPVNAKLPADVVDSLLRKEVFEVCSPPS